jgi:hypothetical protein
MDEIGRSNQDRCKEEVAVVGAILNAMLGAWSADGTVTRVDPIRVTYSIVHELERLREVNEQMKVDLLSAQMALNIMRGDSEKSTKVLADYCLGNMTWHKITEAPLRSGLYALHMKFEASPQDVVVVSRYDKQKDKWGWIKEVILEWMELPEPPKYEGD